MRAKNGWRVHWTENGKRKYRHFEGAKWLAEKESIKFYEQPLKAAKELVKELKERGITAEIVSCRWAIIPTIKQDSPGSGFTWCPFCMQWRIFRLFQVKRKGKLNLAAANRCPVCYISDENYYVKRYNGNINNLTLSRFELTRRYPTKK